MRRCRLSMAIHGIHIVRDARFVWSLHHIALWLRGRGFVVGCICEARFGPCSRCNVVSLIDRSVYILSNFVRNILSIFVRRIRGAQLRSCSGCNIATLIDEIVFIFSNFPQLRGRYCVTPFCRKDYIRLHRRSNGLVCMGHKRWVISTRVIVGILWQSSRGRWVYVNRLRCIGIIMNIDSGDGFQSRFK